MSVTNMHHALSCSAASTSLDAHTKRPKTKGPTDITSQGTKHPEGQYVSWDKFGLLLNPIWPG